MKERRSEWKKMERKEWMKDRMNKDEGNKQWMKERR